MILSGSDLRGGGRFGSTIAAAADLNKDGYNDVIIGAPYVEDNRGAIYVYHGGRDGISRDPAQVSFASDFQPKT